MLNADSSVFIWSQNDDPFGQSCKFKSHRYSPSFWEVKSWILTVSFFFYSYSATLQALTTLRLFWGWSRIHCKQPPLLLQLVRPPLVPPQARPCSLQSINLFNSPQNITQLVLRCQEVQQVAPNYTTNQWWCRMICFLSKGGMSLADSEGWGWGQGPSPKPPAREEKWGVFVCGQAFVQFCSAFFHLIILFLGCFKSLFWSGLIKS